MKIEEIYT